MHKRNEIPAMMKAVFVEETSRKLMMRELALPRPGPGEVLIKMAFSPINPSDVNRIQFASSETDFNHFIPGIEGSGIVVESGKGLLARFLYGKHVACISTHSYSGCWAEYMVTTAGKCFPVPSSIPSEQASMLFVNPMTALAFFDIVKKEKHKALISTAAAGALGKMIHILGERNGIKIIHIVHKEEQRTKLQEAGFRLVLNSTEPGFGERLKEVTREQKATLALDAVGGELSQALLDALPYTGKLLVYGTLSGQSCSISPRSLISSGKSVSGFYLANWVTEKGMVKTVQMILKARSLLNKDISTAVQAKFPITEAQQGMDLYLNQMSKGKVLLSF